MIVTFGSLNMDLVMQVDELPRPGETVLCPSYAVKPGGKGANQAVASARAGAKVAFFGCVGEDDFGSRLIQNLNLHGIETEGVLRASEPTGCATICVDRKGENAIAVASGANLAAAADQVPDEALAADAIVVMQMEVRPEENQKLIERARARGCRTILNVAPARPAPRETLEALDVLIVNEVEAAALARRLGLRNGDLDTTLDELAGIVRQAVVATLGGRGARAAIRGVDGRIESWRVDALDIEPVDTTGAGDAFVGVLAAGLDEGLSLPEALRRASVGAALACLALGAQESLPGKEEIDARLADLPTPERLDVAA